MTDPHVVSLIYNIKHGQSVDYSEAKPMCHGKPEFHVKIANEKVCFKFNKHHATEEAAKRSIAEYICAWEVVAGLMGGPDCFKLKYDGAQIEDRKPTPGVLVLNGSPLRSEVTISKADVTVSPSHYPSPPLGLKITPDVQTLYDRYMGYLQGKEPLASMAYFCLTVLERSTEKKNSRKVASETYGIKLEVLKKIGNLSSEKGGQQARKAVGKDEDLTTQDRRFLEEAIKAVIRRAAERAHDPDRDLLQISMADLPALKTTHR